MPSSEAQKRAVYKYAKNHLKRVPLDLKLSDYELLKQAADAAGMPVNSFVKNALRVVGAISGDPVQAAGADPVQAAPVGESGGAGGGGVTSPNTRE